MSELYPCNNYRAIKYPPVSIECGMEYPPVSQTLLIQGDNLSPCIIYRAFLNTGGSYCTNSTLCNGSTRGKVSEERDKTWANLIKKGLQNHPKQDRTNRPVWSWLQRDKLSSAWLQALPGPDTSLTSAEFSEAAAAALCIPSPACGEKLGQVIRGRQVVDLFGETVQSTITTGDHYRKRHDAYKMRLF